MRTSKTITWLCTTVIAVILVSVFSADSIAAVNGKVVDTDNNPVVGATVATNVSTIGDITDTNGEFLLQATEGVTHVTVSSIGYITRQFEIEALPRSIVLQSMYYRGDDITVTADRAELGVTPIAFENMTKEEIEKEYTVGEFPLLLSSTPNVYSFADGGAPLGYSYTKIRGFDDKRIVTYINGVPLNDPEDHATYFVDMPDFAANVTDIQIQRGVGNSLYGDGSFGGAINIVTSAFDQQRMASVTYGYGVLTHDGEAHSDMYKQSVEYSSGLIGGRWAFSGRFSKQKSGGYRYNSWYDGWSYYFSLGRVDPRMTTELYVYGGPIRMHLSYWAAPREELIKDRLYNPLFYNNETDNFNQPHYHLHNRYKVSDNITLSNTLYYIRGKGYYEQLRIDADYADYDLLSVSSLTSGDLVRQQWVEKSQYGWNPRLDIKHDKGTHSVGGSVFYFESDHWGQVVWAENVQSAEAARKRYYQYFGKKLVGSLFAQELYDITEKFSVQAAIQLRYQNYELDQVKMGAYAGYDYDVDWLFLSPRIGFTYKLNKKTSLYTNFSTASRTPSDVAIYDANDPNTFPSLEIASMNISGSDTTYTFGDPTAKSERVYDLELGGTYTSEVWTAGVNLFWMEFKNEIIPEGGINESGILYTTNADRSVHAGVEVHGAVQINEYLKLDGNWSYNYNRIKEYAPTIDGFVIDYKDKTIPLFPDYIGNLRADVTVNNFFGFIAFRFVGKQYTELSNSENYFRKITPYMVANLSLSHTFTDLFGEGDLIAQVKVNNLFDRIYDVSGYGGNYAYDDGFGNVVVGSWAEFYVAPERTIFGQMKLNLF